MRVFYLEELQLTLQNERVERSKWMLNGSTWDAHLEIFIIREIRNQNSMFEIADEHDGTIK